MNTIGLSCSSSKSTLKQNVDTNMTDKYLHSSINEDNQQEKKQSSSQITLASNQISDHTTNRVWKPEYVHNQTLSTPTYDGDYSPDQTRTPDSMITQEDNFIDATETNESMSSTLKNKDPVRAMINWTEKLQEELRNKKPRETSASSTKGLIPQTNASDC